MARHLSCPACQSMNVRLLPHVSTRQSPDFYRCESCGDVWWVPKAGVTGGQGEKPEAPKEPETSPES
jgi:transposase-like protein